MKLRTSEMIAILGDYPDSSAALNDLKYALNKTKMYNYFSTSVKEQFANRLLIPGVNTILIIEQYIRIINAMKIIDPSTILLEVISEPIKEYLR